MAHAGKNVVSSQHSKPFAYVEYQVDKYRMPVPQSFIKDFDAQNWSLGQEYWVFWSPKSADTPTSILRSQGVLLDLDNEKETHQRGQSSAMPGYYKALILQVAGKQSQVNCTFSCSDMCRVIQLLVCVHEVLGLLSILHPKILLPHLWINKFVD